MQRSLSTQRGDCGREDTVYSVGLTFDIWLAYGRKDLRPIGRWLDIEQIIIHIILTSQLTVTIQKDAIEERRRIGTSWSSKLAPNPNSNTAS